MTAPEPSGAAAKRVDGESQQRRGKFDRARAHQSALKLAEREEAARDLELQRGLREAFYRRNPGLAA